MNIFWLDTDTVKCAEYHCDKHVVKMILESCQLLSTAHHVVGNESDAPYKKTHTNHPCAIWARDNKSNYILLHKLGVSLCNEYTKRYRKVHKCHELLLSTLNKMPVNIVDADLTIPPLAMPDDVKVNDGDTWDDVVESYRLYYTNYKHSIANWFHSPRPDWMF